MQKIRSELVKNKILVKNPKDVGRLYNKSSFGETTAGNKLHLDLLEGVFLLDEDKIKIYDGKKVINFEKLVKKIVKQDNKFDVKYPVFKNLRKRGHHVKLNHHDETGFDFYIKKNKDKAKDCFVKCFSERSMMDINDIEKQISISVKKDGDLWFAIVDDEGDITFYDVSKVELKGDVNRHKFADIYGILLGDKVVVFDEINSEKLLQLEFFGKPFGNGLHLSMVETLYLMKNNILSVKDADKEKSISFKKVLDIAGKSQPDIDLMLSVYSDLKKQGLIVKTGFKFGTHFRAYTKKPDCTHAEYLVHAVDKDFKGIWSEISRAVRLAHSVNKEIMFARVMSGNIDYIKFGRLRP